jgi:Protein kinase domain
VASAYSELLERTTPYHRIAMPPRQRNLVGHFISGRYQLERYLGSGSFGQVWQAVELEPGSRHGDRVRHVAVKLLMPEVVFPSAKTRFDREATIGNQIGHPSILRVLDHGVHRDHELGDVFFLVTEYARGGDLRGVLSGRHGRTALPPIPFVLAVLGQVASALDAAHAAGVIHRDVSLGNILLYDDDWDHPYAYLSDFGIARDLLGETFSQQPFHIWYAPPEARRNEKMTPRSDQYALACVAYVLLSGDLPFTGTPEEINEAHLSRRVPPITDRRALELPSALNASFDRALSKEPTARFDSCRDFHRALCSPLRAAERDRAIEQAVARERRGRVQMTHERDAAAAAASAAASERDRAQRAAQVLQRRAEEAEGARKRRRMWMLATGLALVGVAFVLGLWANSHAGWLGHNGVGGRSGRLTAADARGALRAAIPYPDNCGDTDFSVAPLDRSPPGLLAGFTCKTPAGVTRYAFYQMFSGTPARDEAFATMVRSGSFGGGSAQPRDCGQSKGRPAQWGVNGRSGLYACAFRRRAYDGNWLIWTEGENILVEVLDSESLSGALEEWNRARLKH